MQEGNNNHEEGMKFGILLHSHKTSVSLLLGAEVIFIYTASTIIVSKQLLITNSLFFRALQRGGIFI